MHKGFIKIAALFGALSVALGAFAAHGLKKYLPEEVISIFETAVRYQFYHVFALLITAILYKDFSNNFLKIAGRLFIAGIILFSGSLYLLTYGKGNGLQNLNWLGAVTPLGGACFIAGWVCLFFGIIKNIQA